MPHHSERFIVLRLRSANYISRVFIHHTATMWHRAKIASPSLFHRLGHSIHPPPNRRQFHANSPRASENPNVWQSCPHDLILSESSRQRLGSPPTRFHRGLYICFTKTNLCAYSNPSRNTKLNRLSRDGIGPAPTRFTLKVQFPLSVTTSLLLPCVTAPHLYVVRRAVHNVALDSLQGEHTPSHVSAKRELRRGLPKCG